MPRRCLDTSKFVTASRGVSVSSEIRVGSRRSRPIGASMRPRLERGRPRTRARYSRTSFRRPRSPCRRRCASSERATTRSPDVSRSRRWTIPGRSASSPPATACPRSPWTSVRSRGLPTGGRRSRQACRRPADARPRRRCGDRAAPARGSTAGCSGTLTRARRRPPDGGSSAPASPFTITRLSARAGARPPPESPRPRGRRKRSRTLARRLRLGLPARDSAKRLRSGSPRRSAPDAWLPLRRDEREEAADAHDDERVGEVEGRPEAEVEEVRHVADAQCGQRGFPGSRR